MFEDITYFVGRLDDANLKTREELTLRILKIGEEYGEACTAWIGYTGQNPRKGVCATKDEVIDELLDTAITALVAAESIIGIPIATRFNNKTRKIQQRWKVMKDIRSEL